MIAQKRIFELFEEISSVPRGSGNMKAIADYCVAFAGKRGLDYYRDDSDNVIIYKPATIGYEHSDTLILQGHLDIVCQKTDDRQIDFEKDGLEIYEENGYVKARGTTLGADNGIAVAIILAVLESDDISHPSIEAVFTTDEEIGMIGALKLDFTKLSGKKMINLDSEAIDTVTVSCAGGSDFAVRFPVNKLKKSGFQVKIELTGLLGGHSGVEINSGRVNADVLLGRILNHLYDKYNFDIIDINGGNKGNAIPNKAVVSILLTDLIDFIDYSKDYMSCIKEEISAREPDFSFDIINIKNGEFYVLDSKAKDFVLFSLSCAPNGVIEMSKEIEGLVETSMNLGILSLDNDNIYELFTLRSNKRSAMIYLEERLKRLFSQFECEIETSGYYPPWEYVDNSYLQNIYEKVFEREFGFSPKVEAIHAGLECGVFSSGIDGLECISIGPEIYDVHTVNERLEIASVYKLFDLLIEILKECK